MHSFRINDDVLHFVTIWFIAGHANAEKICKESNGYYPDPYQCDSYFACRNGQPYRKHCPDGLVFDSRLSPATESCNYPFLSFPCPKNSTLRK